MKKIGLLLTALLLTVVFAQAQQRGGDPAERAKRQVEELKTTLDLSDDQATKIEAIILDYGKKTSELRQSMGADGDRSAMREKMGVIREEQTKQIKALLNEDQVKKYDTYLEEQAERRRNRSRG
ncbi:MAG: hypothetical protein HQ541_12130 [Mariniphaga sp.]|nr:hypothetical protein [Mariniphaga sp.]